MAVHLTIPSELLVLDVDGAWIDTDEELETAANEEVVITTEEEVVVASSIVADALELGTTISAPPYLEIQDLS